MTGATPHARATPAQVLRTVFGHSGFRAHQEAIIEHVTAGRSALVVMPTGSGKSLCYQVPALVRGGTAVVISPLVALMNEQAAALREAGVRAGALNSSRTRAEARRILAEARAGALEVLYLSPERALGEGTTALLAGIDVALVAVDEAHCVSQWGHDFRPEYQGLAALHGHLPPRTVARAHRHRRRADAERDLQGPRARRRPALRVRVRPPEHPLRDRREGGRTAPARSVHREAARPRAHPRERDRLPHDEEGDGGDRAVAARARRKRRRLPRGDGQRDARGPPRNVHRGGRRDHGRDHRLRHGDGQAGRALRRPPRPAPQRRVLLPGDGARGTRRRARRGVDVLRAARRGARAPHGRGKREPAVAKARRAGEARAAARAVRAHHLPQGGRARLLRRGLPGTVRALRQLHEPRPADRRHGARAEGALVHLPHRTALRLRPRDRRAARTRHREGGTLGARAALDVRDRGRHRARDMAPGAAPARRPRDGRRRRGGARRAQAHRGKPRGAARGDRDHHPRQRAAGRARAATAPAPAHRRHAPGRRGARDARGAAARGAQGHAARTRAREGDRPLPRVPRRNAHRDGGGRARRPRRARADPGRGTGEARALRGAVPRDHPHRGGATRPVPTAANGGKTQRLRKSWRYDFESAVRAATSSIANISVGVTIAPSGTETLIGCPPIQTSWSPAQPGQWWEDAEAIDEVGRDRQN